MGGELCVTSRTPPFRSVEPICQTQVSHTRTQTTPDSNLRRVSTVGLESLCIFFQFDSVERVPPTANTGPANVKTRLRIVSRSLCISLCVSGFPCWVSMLIALNMLPIDFDVVVVRGEREECCCRGASAKFRGVTLFEFSPPWESQHTHTAHTHLCFSLHYGRDSTANT